MNHAQKQVVWSGAIVAAVLGAAAVRELSKPGANCRDEVRSYVDHRGRVIHAKSTNCD